MQRSEEQESVRVPLTAMFRQLDSSTVEVDTTPDLAAGLTRLTSWLRGPAAPSRKLVLNETIADADSRSLVEAARRGNREAFGVLYDRYVDKVFRTEAAPEQLDRTADVYETLLAGIRRLGVDQRRCITLRFLEDQSVAQTAKVMNRNEATVRALQRRAVRHLARLLPSDLGD